MEIPRMKLSRRNFAFIALAFVITRLVFTGVGAVIVTAIPSTQGEAYTHLLDGGAALDQHYRWDAGFYTSIATYGYDWYHDRTVTADMAFFPVYPTLIHAVSLATGMDGVRCWASPYLSTCTTISALIVSQVALFAACVLLFDLAFTRFGEATARRAVILLLIAPNIIYLSGVYTESLFLLLCLFTFWLMQRDHFFAAVIVACVAALTRSVGIALVPALLYTAWTRSQGSSRRVLNMSLACLPVIVFAGYIVGIGLWSGDPLAYFQAYQTTWERASTTPIEAFTVYFTADDVALFGWSPAWIDLIATVIYLALTAAVFRVDRTWGLFALACIAIPIATGSLLSMPRFGAVIFPFYIVIASWLDVRRKQALAYAASFALALFILSRFVTWRWIA
jgi:hypothetical protein